MVIVPGQEGIVISLTRVSIHGDEYVDVVIADPGSPEDLESRIGARLGPEAIGGDVAPGSRVRVEGFLRMITRIEKVD
jgi:hypothetical protein